MALSVFWVHFDASFRVGRRRWASFLNNQEHFSTTGFKNLNNVKPFEVLEFCRWSAIDTQLCEVNSCCFAKMQVVVKSHRHVTIPLKRHLCISVALCLWNHTGKPTYRLPGGIWRFNFSIQLYPNRHTHILKCAMGFTIPALKWHSNWILWIDKCLTKTSPKTSCHCGCGFVLCT